MDTLNKHKIGLIISVGTTPEPIIRGIRDISNEGKATVYLIYGRPFENQDPDPFKAANQAKGEAEKLGMSVRVLEIPDPENLDCAIEIFREAIRDAASKSLDWVVVDFTGGTKVMSAALVHVALTEQIEAELRFHYTGGVVRDDRGRVPRESMEVRRSAKTATQELCRRIMRLLEGYNYPSAVARASQLPEKGKAGFLKRAVSVLYLWDNFDYEKSSQILRELKEQASVLLDDGLYKGLSDTIQRLNVTVWRLIGVIKFMRGLEDKQAKISEIGELKDFCYLVADALNNADRKIKSGRPVDCVLRAYRAVENSIQIRLVSLGINPWHPDWEEVEQEVLKDYLEELNIVTPPSTISLYNGFKLIELLDRTFDDNIRKALLYLSALRNGSFLEHGFQKTTPEGADCALERASEICAAVIGRIAHWDLKEKRDQMCHLF